MRSNVTLKSFEWSGQREYRQGVSWDERVASRFPELRAIRFADRFRIVRVLRCTSRIAYFQDNRHFMVFAAMIGIRGIHSVIAEKLIELLPPEETVYEIPRGSSGKDTEATRFVFLQGLLRPRKITDQTVAERAEEWSVNAAEVIAACDRIIEEVPQARIVVLGSESGFSGSFDWSYAGAKAALHRYVETKMLRTSMQQLICVSPGIVADAGMTTRRADQHNVMARRQAHRLGRLIDAVEVARLIHFILYVDRGYLSGTVLRMNGGEHIGR